MNQNLHVSSDESILRSICFDSQTLEALKFLGFPIKETLLTFYGGYTCLAVFQNRLDFYKLQEIPLLIREILLFTKPFCYLHPYLSNVCFVQRLTTPRQLFGDTHPCKGVRLRISKLTGGYILRPLQSL